MFQVLEKLQLPIGPLGQDRCAEGLHNLLHGNTLICELVAGRAAWRNSYQYVLAIGQLLGRLGSLPNEAKSPHPNRLEIRIPAVRMSELSRGKV